MSIDYENIPLSTKEKLMFISIVFGIGLTIGRLFYDSFLIGIVASLILFLYFPNYKKKIKEKRRDELLIQFRDMLYSISASISLGRNMTQALEESIHFWNGTYSDQDYILIELKDMVNRIKNSNEKDLVVLKDFARRTNLEDVNDFVNVYESTRESGGNLIRAINRATNIIGEKITLEKDLKVMLASKALEGKIIGLAPFVIMGFLKLSSPEYLEPLISTPKGHFISTIALILIGISFLACERINKINV